MLFCGIVDNLPHWPWDNKRLAQKKSPRLRQVHTRMSGAFFHKGISRFEAELYLTKAKEDGSFLVRDSESLSGAYVLCLLLQSKVHQYRVLPAADRKLHVQSEMGTVQRGYNDLTELIAEYIKKGDQNGLASALIHPVPPDGTADDLDLTDNTDDEDFESPPPLVSPPAVPPHRQSSTSSIKQTDPNKVDLHRNLARLDLGYDSPLGLALKDYADTGVQRDMVSINVGESELPEFTKVLEIASQGLKRELDTFMKKMDIINDFLKVGDSRFLSLESRKKLSGPVIPSMLEQLSRVRSEILNVQTKAQETVQLASIISEYEFIEPVKDDVFAAGDQQPLCAGPFQSSTYRPYIPQSKFEVKKIKNHKPTHTLTLTVDLQNGRYSILKLASKEALDQTTISHEKIQHLIKSTKDRTHLDIVLEGKKKQTYAFNDHHVRENFCLQIRQMKTMHSTETEIDQISIFIGTWNMGDTSPNQSLSTWLKCSGAGKSRDKVLGFIPHDMYVIGTQESTMTEKDWTNTVKAGLKACVLVDMELVEVCTLWGIRMVILVKPEHKHCISRVQRSSVRTGIANALGNKGAVAISMFFNGTSFCFINSHLTSGDERCVRRNQNYRDIIKGMTMSLGQKHLPNFDITNEFNHVFFVGDLNYRIEENIQLILTKTVERDLSSLIEKDQLKNAQKSKTAFCGFQEADITFLPTYRLERNMPGYKYAWKKIKRTGERINAPSWCDRVLWRSYPGLFIENVAYGCSEAILSSDHRPVFSSFNVGISSEFVQTRSSMAELNAVKIIFHSIEAQVKTCCKQYFAVMFYSSCLQEIYKSESNTHFQDNRTGFYTVPYWQSAQIPEMKPLFGDQDFLEDQHILIAVVSRDADHESYGECVVSLKDMFSSQPKEFEYMLLHQGEATGKIRGTMHVTTKSKHRNSKKSPYALIAFDTEYQDPEMFLPDKPKGQAPIKIARGNSSSMKPQPGAAKQPLRNALSSYSEDSRQYEYVESRQEILSTKLDARAPQPLPQTTPIPPPRKNPVMGQQSLLQGAVRVGQPGVIRQTSSPPISHAPPPVPPKSKSIKGKDSSPKAEQQRPQTVDEWLAQLNLSCYEHNFNSNGWKSLMVLNELTAQHLANMQIEVPDHQQRILASVKELNKNEAVNMEPIYSLGTEIHEPTYSLLEVEDGGDYIEFTKTDDDEDITLDSDIKHEDGDELYDTFRPIVKIEEPALDDNHDRHISEELFMTLDELRGSPSLLDDSEKAAQNSSKTTDTEDVFMSLREVMDTPRRQAHSQVYVNQSVQQSPSMSRHSHPGYLDTPKQSNRLDMSDELVKTTGIRSKPDYVNVRPQEDGDEETFMSLDELKVSMVTQDSKSPHPFFEQPDANISDSNLYDQTNKKEIIVQAPTTYDHIYFLSGKPVTSVEEWLKHLDLSYYKHNFLDNGWNTLVFLHEMTKSDLESIGIADAEHQCILLQSIKSLNLE